MDLLTNLSLEENLYGVVFCKTGCEEIVANEIKVRMQAIQAVAIRQTKHYSTGGKKGLIEQRLFPGYVFISVGVENGLDKLSNPFLFRFITGAYRLLTVGDGQWALYGADEAFAKWIMKRQGFLGLSRVSVKGGSIHVLSGPLKDMEKHILKFDRRSRNGLVEIDFVDRKWRFWLAYEEDPF